MDPELLNILSGLFSGPAGAGSGSPFGAMFGNLREFMEQEQGQQASRLNVDPLRDIAPFRVNPFRGFLAEHGGEVSSNDIPPIPMQFVMPSSNLGIGGGIMDSVRGQVLQSQFESFLMGGQVPSVKGALRQLDTINNVPSNMPNPVGGKFDIPQLEIQQKEQFMIPKLQPFSDPVFGNKLLDVDNRFQPAAFEDGGFVETLIVDDNEETHKMLSTLPTFEEGGTVGEGMVLLPVQFSNGGPVKIYQVEKAFLGKLIKGIGKGIGKVAKGVGKGIGKGLGALSDVAGFAAPVLSMIPGVGQTIAPILGAAGGLGDFFQGGMKGGIGGFLSNVGGGALSGVGGGLLGGAAGAAGKLGKLAKIGKTVGDIGGIASGLSGLFGGGQSPAGGGGGSFSGFSSPLGMLSGVPDSAFNIQPQQQIVSPTIGSLFSRLNPGGLGQFGTPGFMGLQMPNFQFQHGGPVQGVSLIPIQTEKVGKQPEMIVHIDGTITKVNADTRHKYMDPDIVTDIVPEGSYIASADKAIKMTKKYADDVIMGIKDQPYKEWKKGKVPKEVTLADLWGSSNKAMTPAELVDKIRLKFNTVDGDRYYEHGSDIFIKRTNQENMQSRFPYLAEVVRYNEEKRINRTGESNIVESFGGGGKVRYKNVEHANLGKLLGKIGGGIGKFFKSDAGKSLVSALPSALPALGGAFGGATMPDGTMQNAAGIDPRIATGILGTIPMHQLGVNQNIAAQSGALGQGIEDFSALGRQLQDFAAQSAGVQQGANIGGMGLGLAGQFAQQFTPQLMDLSAQRSRLQGFRPRSASRAAMEAAATPQFDQQALAALGPRGATVLAQAESDRMRQSNQLAQQRNQFLDQFEMNRIGQLGQLDLTEQQANLPELRRIEALRNQRTGNVFGTLQGGLQRGADIQSGLLGQRGQIMSQLLPITTQMNVQRAGLAGQRNILGAQNALNAFTTLGGIQSQNALAQLMAQQQGAQQQGAFANVAPQFQNPQALAQEAINRQNFIGGVPGQLDTLPMQGVDLGKNVIPSLQTNNAISPVTSQTQRSATCRNGLDILTGQPC